MNNWINHPSFPNESTPPDWTDEPGELERFGLTFDILWDPAGQRWLRVTDSDGRMIAFEPLLVELALPDIVDEWFRRRLCDLTPKNRCDECDLPVELVESLPPWALNQAVRIELRGGYVGRRERGCEHVTLCTTCFRNLCAEHQWFDNLLDQARARRRLR